MTLTDIQNAAQNNAEMVAISHQSDIEKARQLPEPEQTCRLAEIQRTATVTLRTINAPLVKMMEMLPTGPFIVLSGQLLAPTPQEPRDDGR